MANTSAPAYCARTTWNENSYVNLRGFYTTARTICSKNNSPLLDQIRQPLRVLGPTRLSEFLQRETKRGTRFRKRLELLLHALRNMGISNSP